MKKTTSIFLLLILLFNMIGYRAWFYYAEKKSDSAIEARLDSEQYDEQDLVSVTIPLHNPYQLEQKSFVRISGEVSFEGKTYKYVKGKVSDGNLTLLCIPDFNKMVLKRAQSEFGTAGNDIASNKSANPRSDFHKSFNGNDYVDHLNNYRLSIAAIFVPNLHGYNGRSLTDPLLASPGKPPQNKA